MKKLSSKGPRRIELGQVSVATRGANKGIVEFIGLYTPAVQVD